MKQLTESRTTAKTSDTQIEQDAARWKQERCLISSAVANGWIPADGYVPQVADSKAWKRSVIAAREFMQQQDDECPYYTATHSR